MANRGVLSAGVLGGLLIGGTTVLSPLPVAVADSLVVTGYETGVYPVADYYGDGNLFLSETSFECVAEGTPVAGSFRVSVPAACLDGFVIDSTGEGYGYYDEGAVRPTGPLTIQVAGEERFITWSQGLARSGSIVYSDLADRFDPDPSGTLYVFDADAYPCDDVLLGVLPADGAGYTGESLECADSLFTALGTSRTSGPGRVFDSDASEGWTAWVSEEPGRRILGSEGSRPATTLQWSGPAGQTGTVGSIPDDFTVNSESFTTAAVSDEGRLVVGLGYSREYTNSLAVVETSGGNVGGLSGIELPDWLFVTDAQIDVAANSVAFTAQLYPLLMNETELDTYQDDLEPCPWRPNCVYDFDSDVYVWDLDTDNAAVDLDS